MNFYANLKIRNKIILGYAAVALLCCLIGFFGIRGLTVTKIGLDSMHDNLIPSIIIVNDIDRNSQQYRRVYLRYMLETSPQRRKELGARLSRHEAAIKNSLELFGKLQRRPKELELSNAIAVQMQGFCDVSGKVRNAMNSGTRYDELSAEHQQTKKLSEQLEKSLEQLSQLSVNESEDYYRRSNSSYDQLRTWLFITTIMSFLLAGLTALFIANSIVNPLQIVLDSINRFREGSKEKARLATAIAGGDLEQEVTIAEPLTLDTGKISEDEAGMLLKAIIDMNETQYSLDHAFAVMTRSLRHNHDQDIRRDWLKNAQNELHTIMRGDRSTEELTKEILSFLTSYIGATVGAFYVFNENDRSLKVTASYALTQHKGPVERIALGEGVAGQAALEQKMICLTPAPPDYLQISSGLGEAEPINIVVLPLVYNNTLSGVIEIGSFKTFSPDDLELLNQANTGIAIALNVNKARQLVNELLEQTQNQSEKLQLQQEELQQSNEELEERAQTLEQQREQIHAKNCAAEKTSQELRHKAKELERASSYKSEFLANMSHELRTPLNSMMILSSLLKDNREGNLSDKQVEFAAIINGAGKDLLNLINDILDLSKIESGHMEFHYEELTLPDLCEKISPLFHPIAESKGIKFTVTVAESSPESITVDSQRTQQILKNLLSNACKFTSHGTVSLLAYTPDAKENPLKTQTVAFAVNDSGIGIPDDKQSLVFNAFQQADGSTNRAYGGTGLGLSISRQLARSMGGEITLASEEGKGSTFTLYLPVKGVCPLEPAVTPDQPTLNRQRGIDTVTHEAENFFNLFPAPIPDDREQMHEGDRSILIIEDDLSFAGVLADMVRERFFSVLVADEGESGIALAERYQPSAIILDIMLPHIDGWGVMRSLKSNPRTRHIPVHFITCLEERQKAMSMGAIGYVTKPVSSEQLNDVFKTLESSIEKSMKKLLLVEDDPVQALATVALLKERNVTISVAECGARAIELLGLEPFDCIVLDLGLADMGAFELLNELKRLDPERLTPVIIHTGRELTRDDELKLHGYAESIIIKGAKSPERLLNEVTLFLHLVEASLDPDKQLMIRAVLDKESMLGGKKVLIVDDDMRNIFSLSSALSEKDMIIFEAENGREALKQLDEHPDLDLVLMDIMMPEMDGFEAMRLIRTDARFSKLPIIALTAKAMKGDREECLKAGASDYIPKPVDMGKLFSLLRVWLYSETASDQTIMKNSLPDSTVKNTTEEVHN